MNGRDDLARRHAFLALTEEDLRALRALRPALEPRLDELAVTFRRHLESFAPTRAPLGEPGVAERLQEAQRANLMTLVEDPAQPNRAAAHARIAAAHAQVGLAPAWALGAYALYSALLVPLVLQVHPHDPVAMERALRALQRTLLLDAQLALEAAAVEVRAAPHRGRAAEDFAWVATVAAGLAHEIGTPPSRESFQSSPSAVDSRASR